MVRYGIRGEVRSSSAAVLRYCALAVKQQCCAMLLPLLRAAYRAVALLACIKDDLDSRCAQLAAYATWLPAMPMPCKY